jgi:site-specific recombinase XerD
MRFRKPQVVGSNPTFSSVLASFACDARLWYQNFMRNITLWQNNNGYWYLWYIDDNGKRQKISTKTKSRTEAKAFREKFIAGDKKPKSKPAVSIKHFSDQYFQHVKTNLKPKTAHNVRSCFNELLSFLKNDHRPLSSISVAEAQAFLDEKMCETSPLTVRRHIITLRAAWNTAIRWGYIRENPWTQVKKPKIAQKAPAWMNVHVFIKLLKYVIIEVLAPDDKREKAGLLNRRESEALINHRTLYMLVAVGFNTGLRSAELRNLHFDSLDWANRQIHVRNEPGFITKNYRERVVMMSEMAYEILTMQRRRVMADERDLVFPMLVGGQLKPMIESYVSHTFKKWSKGAGLDPKLNLHSLRHYAEFRTMPAIRNGSIHLVRYADDSAP